MKIPKIIIYILLLISILLIGCGNNQLQKETVVASEEEQKDNANVFVVAGPDSYDSIDTAVFVRRNKEDQTITFQNITLGKQYTLSIEGTTTLYDKYGQSISIDQLIEGDIVDITFLKSKKRLNSLQISSESWSYDSINKYEINTSRNDVTIGNEVYKLTKDTVFYSNHKVIELMDINTSDILTFKGIGNTILSVQVMKGHGYLRLQNDENFIGGFIEIGQSFIRKIEEDMLLTVPEGTYQILISHNGGGGTKDVTIGRNEEISLDIGDLEVAQVNQGMILFSLSPTNTTLYIDGEKIDTSGPVVLDYGIHQIIARADNYKSLTSYIKVGQASAGIDITLDSIEEDADSKEEQEEDVIEYNDSTVSGYYKVYIDSPESAEVYLNGNYIGIAPVSFKKEAGTHTITLRKTEYETRSYTIAVDNEKKDITYSFADLSKITEKVE